MTSQTSTPILTSSTSASSADNSPTDRSSKTESWNYTEMLAGNGNFPTPFSSKSSRTSRNRNSSTDLQYHKTTEDEGEVKDAIPNSTGLKRRKVAGRFQAGWENEKRKTDGGNEVTHTPSSTKPKADTPDFGPTKIITAGI